MTDVMPWQNLIHRAGVLATDMEGKPYKDHNGIFVHAYYTMVPLNPYQMGNLVDAISQANKNGDWYGEFLDIIAVAMEKTGLTELRSNRGNVYTLEQVKRREITR